MSDGPFALFIYRNGPRDEAVPPEVYERALAAHTAMRDAAAERGELIAVAQLDERRGKVVSAHSVTDGPYIESKEWLVGVYLLNCSDEETAVSRAQAICPCDTWSIEVRPIAWKWTP